MEVVEMIWQLYDAYTRLFAAFGRRNLSVWLRICDYHAHLGLDMELSVLTCDSGPRAI